MPHHHAVVWMDHQEAHVFRFTAEDVHKKRLQAHNPFRKVHHKAGAIGDGHEHGDRAFFDETIAALNDVTEWLLVGPSTARTEFLHHVEAHAPELKKKLVGVEPMDHPTDGELVKHARHFFTAVDRMQPNSPARPT